jgi:hypothetical protein
MHEIHEKGKTIRFGTRSHAPAWECRPWPLLQPSDGRDTERRDSTLRRRNVGARNEMGSWSFILLNTKFTKFTIGIQRDCPGFFRVFRGFRVQSLFPVFLELAPTLLGESGGIPGRFATPSLRLRFPYYSLKKERQFDFLIFSFVCTLFFSCISCISCSNSSTYDHGRHGPTRKK